jgi:carbonic anhydrase
VAEVAPKRASWSRPGCRAGTCAGATARPEREPETSANPPSAVAAARIEFEDRLRKETGRAAIAPARFYSFTDAEENTKEQIQKARSHPWIAPDIPVRGFVSDVSTGRLSEVFPDRETVTG